MRALWERWKVTVRLVEEPGGTHCSDDDSWTRSLDVVHCLVVVGIAVVSHSDRWVAEYVDVMNLISLLRACEQRS